jgi:hypothetical protein
MSTKLPEGVRMPPVERPRPKDKVSSAFTGIRKRKLVTGNAGKRRARTHPLKG